MKQDMTAEEAQARALMDKVKKDMLALFEKYDADAKTLVVKAGNDSAPIIAFMQMALANVGVDWLHDHGVEGLQTLILTVNTTGKAMENWTRAALKVNKLEDILTLDQDGEENVTEH